MNVLSLFDGMSCGQIALDRAGIKYNKYYASEIDKHAITVTQANYPNTIQLGDINNWGDWDIDWSNIDLILSGSPCQGFSFAGKGLAFDDPRSALFFKFLDILNFVKSFNLEVKFLLENVKMKKEYLNVISEYVGVNPVFINSSLVSAQNRQRYYWCNWRVSQPEDRGIILADVLETRDVGHIKNKIEWKEKNNKSQCLDTNYHKRVDNHGQRTMIRVSGVTENNRGFRPHQGDKRKSGISELGRILKKDAGKTDSLTTNHAPKLCINKKDYCIHYRKLTPIECERLQTVPDNYTNHVSNTQRYKMLGNGWTVDVIVHILKEAGI